jgi:hypothetical protein
MKMYRINFDRDGKTVKDVDIQVSNIDELLKKDIIDILDECELQEIGEFTTSETESDADYYEVLRGDAREGLLSIGDVEELDEG